MKYTEPEYLTYIQNRKFKEPIKMVLDVEILADGTVGEIVVIDSTSTDIQTFRKQTLDSFKKTIFSPAKKDGKPIAVWITIPITYIIKN